MSYEPTNWKTGDVVTSAKLNKLEQGVVNSGGFLKVTLSHDVQTQVDTMDKTWQEIHDALANGEYVILVNVYPEEHRASQLHIIEACYVPGLTSDSYYGVFAEQFSDNTFNLIRFTCATANDYPHFDNSGEPS